MKNKLLILVMLFSSLFCYAQQRPNFAPVESQSYRGQRTSGTEKTVVVQGIGAQKSENGLIIDVRFSGAVDPRTFTSSNFLINGKPSNTKISFNREGTVARVLTNINLPCRVTVQNVKTYDGKAIPSFSKELK